ncbi:MAG: right-handed parallel beta-helix repeat-containing protein, partial [Pirellulaceae bacterium]
IVDREQITLADDLGNGILFESIVGRDVVFPAGIALTNGAQFSVTGPDGVFPVRFVTSVPTLVGDVQFNSGMSAIDVADAVLAILPGSLNATSNNDGSLSLLAANDVTVIGDVPVGQSNPVQIKVVDTPFQFFPTFIPGTTAASQIVVPSGAELATGESILITGPSSTTQLTYVNIPTGAAGEVVFAVNDTADDIARRIMPQLPSDVAAIYEGNGVITFVNQTTIQLQASVSQIAIDNFQSTTESRIRISAPNGAGLIDDETLTLVSSAGTFVVTFDLATTPSGPGLVTYQAADTINDIVTRLQSALPASLAPIRVGNDIHVLASSASTDVAGTAIQFGQLPSRLITLPDGNGLTDQEILRVSSATGTTDITFIQSATAGPAGTVNFETTDSAGAILARLAAALPLDSITTPSGLVVYGATNSVALSGGSQISTAFVNGQQITIPAGAQLVNNEAVDIVVGATTTTITFIDTAGAVGPNQVAFQAGDAAGVIASRLFAILDPTLNATISGSTISMTADAVNHQLGASNVLISSGIFNANVINIQIPDAVGLRNGEQIQVFGNGTEVITFILRGTTVADVGTIQVYYDPTDVAADLYDEMVTGLLNNYEAYVDPNGMGINIYNPTFNFFAFQGTSPLATINRTEDVDEFAIPITIPNGSQITSGETLTITQKDDVNSFNATTFTLRDINFATGNLNEITYDPTASADVVTRGILAQLPLSLQGYLVNTREIYLLNASSVATSATSNIVSYESAFNAMPILVDSTLTTQEVAARLQSAFAEGLGRHATADGKSVANSDDYKVYGSDRIRLYNTTVFDSGSYGVSAYTVLNDGPLISSAVPGDEFGESLSEAFTASEVKTNGASNNVVEGVYIDDIVIGFAERGEMVLNAPNNNTSFVFNPETLPDTHPAAIQPERQNETLLGGYALEIRTSDEFGVEQDYDPINLELTESFGLGRSFDTNDRLSNQAVTLIVPSPTDLLDGDTFTLDDGDSLMTFEFDNVLDGNVTPGNVRILFNSVNSDPAFVASAVRDAINSSQVQSVLDVTAATSDGLESGTPTGNRVELFGESISVNHSGGRFLKVDLVAEETYQGRETSRQQPVVDHIAETVEDIFYRDELTRSLPTSFVDGSVDTLVAVGKIGDEVNTGVADSNLQDGAVVLYVDPTQDYDSVRIYLEQNQAIDIDVDTTGFSKAGVILDLPVITVFPQERFGAVEKYGREHDLSPSDILAQSSLFAPTAAPGESVAGAFLQFQAPASGYYDVVVSSDAPFGGFGGSGEYQLTIRPNAATSAAVPDRDVLMVDYQFGIGDVNRVSPQGQIIISSNFISDSAQVGILATNAQRGQTLTGTNILNDSLPRPGSAALLRNQNSDGIIPGVVISNNVVTASGDAAIVLAGDTNANGQIAASTVFGRILNNTVVGQGVGDGIRISGSASPTILNNVVAFFNQGIVTTANQTGEVIVGSNAYQNNNTDSTVAISTSSVIIPQEVDLFEDPARRVYIPAAGSNVIDSSFASLPDRADFLQTVKQPVGISPSPIIAPSFDAYGQPR